MEAKNAGLYTAQSSPHEKKKKKMRKMRRKYSSADPRNLHSGLKVQTFLFTISSSSYLD
jgi:hypothetical protein